MKDIDTSLRDQHRCVFFSSNMIFISHNNIKDDERICSFISIDFF